MEPHVAGQLCDHPLATLDGGQAVKPGPHLWVGLLRQLVAVAQPALEDGGNRRHELGDPAERAEHPDDRFLEFGGAVQSAHTVAQQRLLQPPAVRVRQSRPIRVQPLQVGQQVLLVLPVSSAISGSISPRGRYSELTSANRSSSSSSHRIRSVSAGAAVWLSSRCVLSIVCTEPGSRS